MGNGCLQLLTTRRGDSVCRVVHYNDALLIIIINFMYFGGRTWPSAHFNNNNKHTSSWSSCRANLKLCICSRSQFAISMEPLKWPGLLLYVWSPVPVTQSLLPTHLRPQYNSHYFAFLSPCHSSSPLSLSRYSLVRPSPVSWLVPCPAL